MITTKHTTQAKAILVLTKNDGWRFFHKFRKGGHLTTAWCLTGAKLFQSCEADDAEISDIQIKLFNKRYDSRVVMVESTDAKSLMRGQ